MRTLTVWVATSADGSTVIPVAVIHLLSEGISTATRGAALISASLYCGMLAMTRMSLGSKPVIRGLPGVTVSPTSTWRAATIPENGAVMTV